MPVNPPEFHFRFLSVADFDNLCGEVGRKLRQVRVAQGLSQMGLAQQFRISWGSAVRYSWHVNHFDINLLSISVPNLGRTDR
jgi:hypothetical protein